MVECDRTLIFIGPGDNEEMTQYLEQHIPGATIVAYDDSSVTLHFHGNTEHRWFLDGFFPMPSQFPFPYVPNQAQAQAPDTQDFWPNEKPIE